MRRTFFFINPWDTGGGGGWHIRLFLIIRKKNCRHIIWTQRNLQAKNGTGCLGEACPSGIYTPWLMYQPHVILKVCIASYVQCTYVRAYNCRLSFLCTSSTAWSLSMLCDDDDDDDDDDIVTLAYLLPWSRVCGDKTGCNQINIKGRKQTSTK